MRLSLEQQQIVRQNSRDEEAYQTLCGLIEHVSTASETSPDEELRRQNAFLAALNEVTMDLLNRREMSGLLQAIVEHAARIIDAPYGELLLKEGDSLNVCAFTENQAFLAGDRLDQDAGTLSWQAHNTRQPAVIDDYSTWENRRPVYESLVLHAVADFPILVGEECVGVLGLGRQEANKPFLPEQIQQGVLFSRLAALVLDSARLYDKALKEIAERQNAENALRAITDNVRDLVAVVDAQGIIRYTSPSIHEMLGYNPDELIGRHSMDLIHSQDIMDISTSFQNAVHGIPGPAFMEFRCRRANGSHVWLEASGRLIYDANGQLSSVIAILRDTTLRKQLEDLRLEEERLRVELRKEQELNALKTQMMVRIAHEFRTPMSVLTTSSHLLSNHLGSLSAERRAELVNQLQLSVEHVTDLLEDILQSIGNQTIPQVVSVLNLGELCHDVLAEMHSGETTQHEVALVIEDTNLVVSTDRESLTIVLRNLLSNAMKFSHAGAPSRLKVYKVDDEVVLAITDHGIGIPRHELEAIFQPLYRASNVGEIAGLGLGLNIVKDTVAKLGGFVTVQSQLDVGSTFSVHLPYRK